MKSSTIKGRQLLQSLSHSSHLDKSIEAILILLILISFLSPSTTAYDLNLSINSASEFNLSQDKLGEAVGKSRSHIGNIMRILELPQAALALVREGKLTAGHAKALLGHPDPAKAAREVLKKGLNVRQTEALVQAANRTAKAGAEAKAKAGAHADSDITALAESLTERLGLRVDIKYTGKGGQLVLNYANLDQLDSLLALLNG